MNIPNAAVEEMLKAIPDRKQRSQIASIINGKVVKEVYCHSEDIKGKEFVPVIGADGQVVRYKSGAKAGQEKTEAKEVLVQTGCKGRLIARIFDDGRVVMVASEGKAWLRSSRHRFDGHMGFQCWCGQDSLLAEAEKGVIGEAPPTREDLGAIYEKLQVKKPNYKPFQGATFVDGFEIREIA